MDEKIKSYCRLCLSTNSEFDIFENKLGTKITALLSVEVDSTDNFPSKICKSCRIQLEKLYIFRTIALETDLNLRRQIYGEEDPRNRYLDSVAFLRRHDQTFDEHDYGESSKRLMESDIKLKKGNNSTELSDEDYASINKTIKQALEKNYNYYGRFNLKVEEFDENNLIKVRVIKENGTNIIMKIRMPQSFNVEVKSKPSSSSPAINGTIENILKKCELIESTQDKIKSCVIRTEKNVSRINNLIQNYKVLDQGIDSVDPSTKDENAPFELPITEINELWRLNSRISDIELRDAMNEELGRIQPQHGNKIIGRVLRAVIAKDLLGQICWSGRIKVEHKYMKSDDRIMLSKMKNLVDYLFEFCKSKEEDTTMHVFLQTVMNIIRKERFRSKDTTWSDMSEFKEEYLQEEEFDTNVEGSNDIIMEPADTVVVTY